MRTAELRVSAFAGGPTVPVSRRVRHNRTAGAPQQHSSRARLRRLPVRPDRRYPARRPGPATTSRAGRWPAARPVPRRPGRRTAGSGCLSGGGGGVQPGTQAPLGHAQGGHRDQRCDGQPDAQPAGPGVVAAGQGGDRVVDDVRGEQEEGDRDRLLRGLRRSRSGCARLAWRRWTIGT